MSLWFVCLVLISFCKRLNNKKHIGKGVSIILYCRLYKNIEKWDGIWRTCKKRVHLGGVLKNVLQSPFRLGPAKPDLSSHT